MKAAVHFNGGSLNSLAQEVRQFLNGEEFPDYEGFLFCVDGELIDCLENMNSWYRAITKSKVVPHGLFKSKELFTEDFKRCCRGDWMHLKIYGVLEKKVLLGIQSNLESTYISSSPVKITLTLLDKEPLWSFEKGVKRSDLA